MESFFNQRAFASASAETGGTPPASGPTGFHSLFTVLGNPSPAAAPAERTTAAAAEHHAPGNVPQIEVVQEGGRVTKIIVTCKCCERIELDCTY
jgi:hypothetical protein